MQKVIIVESPSKSHTISSYLGKDFLVLSSKGHISDLATSGKDGLGIDIENGFSPTYKIMPQKSSLVNSLKKSCEGKTVFLATDPDREGEAIAYHLAKALNLNLDENNRIEFHEITKNAVITALNNPHKIDLNLVSSQETRRMIDRILGFKLSKLLQRKINSKSAGRVQSVALLLIVELEDEINKFIPEAYYEMIAKFETFNLKLEEINGVAINAKNRITDRTILENLRARLLTFKVDNINMKQFSKQSKPAYTTSSMQQDASNKLGFSPTKTMRVAQSLYEGKTLGNETVGLITYMRTDSTRLSDEFVDSANNYIVNEFGKKYLGKTKLKKQKNMQDAHEAIRPTNILRKPDSIKQYLTNDEYKLYNMIYKRCLASLMADALYSQKKVEFINTDSLWSLTGSTLIFDGYLKINERDEEDPDVSLVPNFVVGSEFNALDVEILDKETEPKKRYTEASLIKTMEELGIGRPSTYAQTIQTLLEREYIEINKKTLIPTEQGILTTKNLHEFFSDIINVKYTANMETDLDMIAEGNLDELEELNKFYQSFIPLLDNANQNMNKKYPIETDEICPKCGNKLFIRLGKYGEFISCSNYPECSYIKKEEPQTENTGILCPICKKHYLIERVAKKGKTKGNIFYACEGYPKCKAIYNDLPTNEICPNCGSMMLKNKEGNLYCSNNCSSNTTEEILCPNCKEGHLILRVAKRGKNKGNEFYGCDNYPKCKTLISKEEYEKMKN